MVSEHVKPVSSTTRETYRTHTRPATTTRALTSTLTSSLTWICTANHVLTRVTESADVSRHVAADVATKGDTPKFCKSLWEFRLHISDNFVSFFVGVLSPPRYGGFINLL
ncbi:hypothetical protein PIB30_001684 [Stylosanthes scabra]|uniref:Uncharacterized protein n=1 Tax=Stylosanthes scabra TaxID=79078 RepID=A0ABU6U1H8_9FABA|nr:hypothetical protein [Stylosanthes scabra]